MRHNRTHKKLGRTSAHRQALFRNQMASLIAHERIITTLAKAKAVRPLAERLVTQGKRNTVHARRMVGRYVADRELIKKLFDTIAPRFAERPGGYLRIVKLGPRYGDGGEQAVLEFVDYERPAKAESPAASAAGK
jgi:large subunit ribosomal protein L17